MAEKKEKNFGEGLGISGFTMSVIGIIFAGYVGILMSIVGIIFCWVQQRKNATKLGKVGIIVGIAGIVLSIVYIIVFIKYLSPLMAQLGGQY